MLQPFKEIFKPLQRIRRTFNVKAFWKLCTWKNVLVQIKIDNHLYETGLYVNLPYLDLNRHGSFLLMAKIFFFFVASKKNNAVLYWLVQNYWFHMEFCIMNFKNSFMAINWIIFIKLCKKLPSQFFILLIQLWF